MMIKPEDLDIDDFIGNKVQIKQLEQCIKEKRPALIHGEPGIGKTTSVYILAKKLGYQVIEYNASDERRKESLEKILKDVQMKSLKPKLFLFDEIDGMKDDLYERDIAFKYLSKILKVSKYPILMTCNELWKVPDYIQNKCEIIRYYPPSKKEIVEFIKKHFGDIKDLRFDKISNDVRNSIISVLTGSEPYTITDPFQEIQNIFKGRDFRFEDPTLWIWLIDNVDRFYEGKQLYEVIQIISDAAMYSNPNLLKTIPKSKNINTKVVYPYFLQRKKVLALVNGKNKK